MTRNPPITGATEIRDLRLRLQLSQPQCATLLGVSPETYRTWDYQKLRRHRKELPVACQGHRHADPGTPAGACWPRPGQQPSDVDTPRRTTPPGGELLIEPRAKVRQRDVRSGDADGQGAGSGRSCRKPAVAPPEGRACPCPARGAFATGGSRRGTAGGGGAASARSTR